MKTRIALVAAVFCGVSVASGYCSESKWPSELRAAIADVLGLPKQAKITEESIRKELVRQFAEVSSSRDEVVSRVASWRRRRPDVAMFYNDRGTHYSVEFAVEYETTDARIGTALGVVTFSFSEAARLIKVRYHEELVQGKVKRP